MTLSVNTPSGCQQSAVVPWVYEYSFQLGDGFSHAVSVKPPAVKEPYDDDKMSCFIVRLEFSKGSVVTTTVFFQSIVVELEL